MRMGPRQAEAMVRAFLGRPPQDEMEAAVVLESWGGVSSAHALGTASRMAFPAPASGAGSPRRPSPARSDSDGGVSVAESLSTLALVMALFLLAAAGGSGASDAGADAWRPAVPVILGMTWLLRRRYGAGRAAVGLLRQESGVLVATTALVTLPLLVVPDIGGMAAAFVVLGVAGSVTVLRGWGPAAAGAVVAVAAAAAPTDAAVTTTFAIAAAVVTALAAAAIATSAPSRLRPRSWRRAAPAGVAGTATGLLLTLVSAGAGDALTWVVAIALVPSLAASTVGGLRLARFWVVVPAALAATSVVAGTGPGHARRAARRLVAGAGALALAVLVTLSVAAHGLVDAIGEAGHVGTLLVGFGAAAAVALAVTLLEAFARPWWAVATASTACGVHAVANAALTTSTASLTATAVALLLATGPLAALLRRPERTMATLV